MDLNKKKHYTVPVFIPQLACPFQCIFCNQEKISGQESIPDREEIRKSIELHLSSIAEGNIVELGFFGGNFTGIPLNIQEEYLKLAGEYLSAGRIGAVRISTRPDYINREVLELLKRYGVKTIELGAQSLDDDVLRLSGRGHKADATGKASEMIKDMGFSLGLQMMIGLPGDTLEKSLCTAEKISELGAECTRVYPALVIKDTKLEELYLKKKYSPLTLDEAVNWSKEVLKVFHRTGVKVIRMGLHPSEGLINGESLVAGPFHISFRELVLTELWADILKPLMKASADVLWIHVAPGQINYAAGYRGKNRDRLSINYNRVRFTEDQSLKEGEFRAYFH